MSLARGGSPKGTQLRAVGSQQPWQEWHEGLVPRGDLGGHHSVHCSWLG